MFEFTNSNFEQEVLKSEMPVLVDFFANWCVGKDTFVLTEDGDIPILTLKQNDKLLSYNPETKKIELNKVNKITNFKNKKSFKIILETGKNLIADSDHLVFTNNGFKKISELNIDDKILTSKSKDFVYEKILKIQNIDNQELIGISVDFPHTIITNGIVSHNCGPCRALTPVLEKLSKEFEGKIKFGKVNTDENEELSSNYNISALPTVLIFNKGKIIKKIVGFHNEDQLRQILNQIHTES